MSDKQQENRVGTQNFEQQVVAGNNGCKGFKAGGLVLTGDNDLLRRVHGVLRPAIFNAVLCLWSLWRLL